MRASLLSMALAVGCAGGAAAPPPPASTEGDVVGPSRASREAAEAPSVVAAEPATATATYVVVELGAREGVEDGAGGRIDVASALAIDLEPGRFPARALDPVLHVGALSFTEYHYAPTGLRYVVDASVLAPDAALYVQYGDDLRSRVELVPAATTTPVTVAP